MIEHLADGKVTLHPGDCLAVLPTLAENSVDSVCTDPPYHLQSIVKRMSADNAAPVGFGSDGRYQRLSGGFMGQKWDGGDIAFRPELWREVLRVLKPGGHLVAFGGTRTFHRLACAIEDAGFEIRDTVSHLHSGPLLWVYASGFPKSLDVSRRLNDFRCMCGMSKAASLSSPFTERPVLQPQVCGDRQANAANQKDLRGVPSTMDTTGSIPSSKGQNLLSCLPIDPDFSSQRRDYQEASNSLCSMRHASERPTTDETAQTESGVLQPFISRKNTCVTPNSICGQHEGATTEGKGQEIRGKQSGMEGRCDVPPPSGQLRTSEIRSLSAGFNFDGQNGRLCDGASPCDGADSQAAVTADGMRASSRPSAVEQCRDQSGTLAMQPQPQERGAWPHCGRCGKPIIPDGLGTALKPAMELIVLARKPLSEGTVAANVMRWGCGALNIDGSRIAANGDDYGSRPAKVRGSHDGFQGKAFKIAERIGEYTSPLGRWPANVVHDGSPEVVGLFPETTSGNCRGETVNADNRIYSSAGATLNRKLMVREGDSGSAARFFYTAKADDDDRLGSRHPTVKPVDLMQWLVRLVTPPGGMLLDLFAGTGTTAEAAFREGMHAVLIEREAEYQDDIRRRMALVMAGPGERARETIKAKLQGKPIDLGPLFGGDLS